MKKVIIFLLFFFFVLGLYLLCDTPIDVVVPDPQPGPPPIIDDYIEISDSFVDAINISK